MISTTQKRILVTGGAGFIGSSLCEYLLNQGHDVLCVDNYFSGNRFNVSHLQKRDQFELIRHDVTNPLFVEVDQIYHLACPASPVFYQRAPVQTIKTCIEGTINMLGLAKRLGCPILLASTSEVYGDPNCNPQSEDYWGNVNPIGIRACYDESKRLSETLCFDYNRQYGVNVKVARIFNTYGPNMQPDDGRVVSNFVVAALREQPIQLYGDGSQSRSFCYVDDTVRGLVALIGTEPDFHGPVNLGNPNEITIRMLAEQVLKLTKSTSELIYAPLPSDDPKQRCPDIRKARTHLNWAPRVPLEQGLQSTINYFTEFVQAAEVHQPLVRG